RLEELRGNLDRARALYERASSDPEQFVRARAHLGALELAASRPERAVETLLSAWERGPADARIVPLLMRAYVATSRPERAEAVVRVALKNQPLAAELEIAHAELRVLVGKPEQAVKILKEAAKRHPREARLFVSLGDSARSLGDVDTAANAYRKALEL